MLQLTRGPLRFWTGLGADRIIAAAIISVTAMTPAAADWRKELGTFRIGMIEAQGKQYSPADLAKLRAAYSGALGMPIEIFQAKDFPSLIDAQASSRIEYAFYTAQAYATAYLACECVEPLAAPRGADGSEGIKAVLLLDEALSIADLAQSKGIGVAGKDSLSTFGVALASFQPKGASLTGSEPWLRVEDGQSNLLKELENGSIDGFFAAIPSSLKLNDAVSKDAALSSELAKTGRKIKAVWLSRTVPNGPHAVRKNLAPEAKEALLKLLAGLAAADPDLNDLLLPDDAGTFSPVSHQAYDLALKATKALADASGATTP